jgi:hypothetical protein
VRAFITNEFEAADLFGSPAEEREGGTRARRAAGCPKRGRPSLLRALWWDAEEALLPPCNNFDDAGRELMGTCQRTEFSHSGLRACNRRQVVIEGTFDPCEGGHMGMYAGGLKHVTYVADSDRGP